MLGKNDFGVFTIYYLSLTISAIIPGSLDTTFIKFAKSKSEDKVKYFSASIVMKSFYVIIVMFLGICILSFDSESVLRYVSLGVMSGSFLCFSHSLATLYQEKENFFKYSIIEMFFSVGVFASIGVVYLFSFDFNINDVLVLYSAVAVVVGLFFLIYLQAKVNFWSKFDMGTIRSLFGLGKWVIGAAIFIFLFPRLDVFLLPFFVSLDDVGVYGAASQLMMAVSLMIRSMSNVVLPRSMTALESLTQFKAYLVSITGSVLAIIGIIFVFIIFSDDIVNITYGNDFVFASKLLQIMLLGTAFLSIYIPFSYLFYAINAPQIRFFIELGKFFFGFIIIITCIKIYGTVGASVGMALTNIIYSVFSFTIILKKIKCHFNLQKL